MKLAWDETGKRLYETGTKKGVLYIPNESGVYDTGFAWNGLIGISEKPSGAEATPIYADDIKYLNLYSNEDFAATIEAYTYPDEFAACDGSQSIAPGVVAGQQTRQPFGLCWRTSVGNDLDGDDYGYKLHLAYGCVASPTEKNYKSMNSSPEAITFSWNLTTTPVDIENFKPTAHLVIDSNTIDAAKLSALEDLLYGTTEDEPSLPTPAEIIALVNAV